MPLYHYQYVDSDGKRRSGHIEAHGDQEAKSKLREQGVLVTQIQAKNKFNKKQHLKGENLISFTIQLSQLINAGVPLYESLMAIEEQSRGEAYHRVVLSLCEQIRSGVPLSAAMATYPESFDKLYYGMIAAGEAVGLLGTVLEKLTLFLNRQMKLKKQISTAMIYPCILGGFSFLIVCMLLGFVVPSLESIFAERKLNAFTNGVLGLSYIFRTYWWLYLPISTAVIGTIVWRIKTPQGKLWIEKILLRLPVIRTLVIQTAVARFCRTMGTLLQGGLNMIESLRISKGVIKNSILEKEIQNSELKIIEGRSLSYELGRSKYFPVMVSRMLAVGEESGTTINMLNCIADMYEQELEKTLDRVMALSQPIILIIMGVVIGTVLLAIMLPLTDVSSFAPT